MAREDGKQNRRSDFKLLPKIFDGALAGIIGMSCVFPIDLVKTRLQNQKVGSHGEKLYNSMLDCFTKVYKTEGIKGLYKGYVFRAILVTPEKAINLAGNDFFRHKLTLPNGDLPMPRQLLAGATAGFCQTSITTPMELFKTQLQDAGRLAVENKAAGKSVTEVRAITLIMGVLKERGIFGIYKGIRPTLGRDVSFATVYFPLYATLNEFGLRRSQNGDNAIWSSFWAGLTSGAISAFCATPFDVIKTRIQAADSQYTGMQNCIVKTFNSEGITAFFKGGACRIAVIAPLFAIAQGVYYLKIAERLLG